MSFKNLAGHDPYPHQIATYEALEKIMKSIFELANSKGETWFEHSKNTFHLGRVLWNLCKKEIRKYFPEDEYLWCWRGALYFFRL